MIFTKALKVEEIKSQLDKENDVISIIGCETCVRVAGSGGEEKMRELALELRSDGYNVVDGYMVPSACTPKIYFATMDKSINTIIPLACNAGYSNLERTYEGYKCVRAIEDVGLMVTDTDKKIIKITMPYQDSEDEIGREYEEITGNRRNSDDGLPIMEVAK